LMQKLTLTFKILTLFSAPPFVTKIMTKIMLAIGG